jgi:hypothetical protein
MQQTFTECSFFSWKKIYKVLTSFGNRQLKRTVGPKKDEVEVEVEVNLPPTVSRPVCLGVRYPSGARDQFFFLLKISFRQLRVYYFVVPSLTRGRVCNLLYNCFWALPERSLLGQSRAELTPIFYCLIWDFHNLEGQVSIFISPKNRVAPVIAPGTGFPFCCLLRLAGLRWRYSVPPPHGSEGWSYNRPNIYTWEAS